MRNRLWVCRGVGLLLRLDSCWGCTALLRVRVCACPQYASKKLSQYTTDYVNAFFQAGGMHAISARARCDFRAPLCAHLAAVLLLPACVRACVRLGGREGMLPAGCACRRQCIPHTFVYVCVHAACGHAPRPRCWCVISGHAEVPLSLEEGAAFCKAMAAVFGILIPEAAAQFFQGSAGFVAAMEVC